MNALSRTVEVYNPAGQLVERRTYSTAVAAAAAARRHNAHVASTASYAFPLNTVAVVL